MNINIKEGVVRQRAEILQGFVALAIRDRSPDAAKDFRAEAEHLLEQLDEADKTIAFLAPKATSPYASCEKAIEAIMAYLKNLGRPAAEQKIIDGLIEAGWLGGKPGIGLRIHKSIDTHLKVSRGENRNPGDMVGKIRDRNGLIGLFQWTDEMFT
jgi:hypothetical protein